MADKIDVIAPVLAECAVFTVNILNDFVAITNVPAVNYYCRNSNAKLKFIKGDSFILISAGIILPENFTFWKDIDSLPSISIRPYGVTSGHVFINPNFNDSKSFIPMENYESVFDTFLPCDKTIDAVDPTKTLLDENYYIQCFINETIKISMQNVPAAMNGKTFKVVPFLKILHTNDMIV